MPNEDPIAVSYSTLDALKTQMAHLSNAFDNTVPPVRSVEAQLATGAGQFASAMSFGAASFTMAWAAGFTAMADGSALISNNIGSASLDFSAVDVAASSDYVL